MADFPRSSDRSDLGEHKEVLDSIANALTGQRAADLTPTGDIIAGGNLGSKSGTAFTVTFDHTATANRTITVQDADQTLVGRDTTDILTHKTMTNPTINAATLSGSLTGTPDFAGAVTFSGLAWTTTGTFTVTQGGAAIATSSFTARYLLIGKLCILQVVAVMNGAGNALSAIKINVPSAIQSRAVGMRLGVMEVLLAATGVSYSGVCNAQSATAFQGVAHNTAGPIGTVAPMAVALAAGDVVSLDCQYEVA